MSPQKEGSEDREGTQKEEISVIEERHIGIDMEGRWKD
jgi:hypothetical protein